MQKAAQLLFRPRWDSSPDPYPLTAGEMDLLTPPEKSSLSFSAFQASPCLAPNRILRPPCTADIVWDSGTIEKRKTRIQETQLSQIDRAMLHVIEHFASH